ncbi:type III secretion protein [Dyella monticola]|uniref:Type III secretion protein n=1 Tax=Dyella monticola TaxID=1927958 RepID=A0A370X360_9GAMM|nr:flagellar biosynthesis protein FlhA [Dyella monticola]RDS82782.1 type III secretion protein [Dyella monticola]
MNLTQFGDLKRWDITPFVERYIDIAMGLVFLTIISLLVLPTPGFLLDMAIATNFSFSLLLIAVAIYIKSTLDLAIFPSLLLLTTLFRLGLEVATTKGILLHAHAGEMVAAFGQLVVGGNVVVGLVIFLLLCVVQIVVVAKGGDRVAEVAARFTLDAIPGKQMSIDADLRSNVITPDEARARREVLQQEIQLHGALDGAMKFVKGDAMIGIIVALINIVGGIAVGVAQHHLTFSNAVNTYVILTVGDGLVSQIPSLMVAIAAGLVITRGDSGGSSSEFSNLGRRIYDQVANQPRPVLMASTITFILAVIPGFPHVQFALIGLALLGIGTAKRRHEQTVALSRQAPMPNMARDGSNYVPCLLDTVEFGTTVPLRVRVGRQAYNALAPADFNSELGNVRRYLMQNLGLPFPGLSMVGEPQMGDNSYVIEVNDTIVISGELYAREFVVHGPFDVLADCNPERSTSFPGSKAAYWVDSATMALLRDRGANVASPDEALAAQIYAICHHHAHEFVGTQEAQFLINRLRSSFPDLVAALLTTVTPTIFGRLLAELLEESVSIRNLRGICEALVRMPAGDRSRHRLLEVARMAVVPLTIPTYTEGESTLKVIVIDEAWGTLLSQALRIDNDGEPCLALSFQDSQRLQASLQRVSDEAPASAAVLTSASLRRHIAGLLKGLGIRRHVLALEEIPSESIVVERVAVVERDND